MAGILRRAGADAGKRPARRDTRQEPPKKSVKARGRRVQHGATRNPVAREKTVEGGKIAIPSVWLNRLLILLGAAVVLTAGIKAFVTVQSLPVQRISVTGELEHTQAQLVQDIVQPGLVGGFLNADLKQIQRQLEGLPWIYEANVRRKCVWAVISLGSRCRGRCSCWRCGRCWNKCWRFLSVSRTC